MIWLDKECSSGDFTYENTWQHSAVPTQLSTLCLKINISIPREENHFICWIGLLSWHPWKPRASFLGIVLRHRRSGGSRAAASRWHWEAAAVPEVVLEVSDSSEKHCWGIGASPALKMVLVSPTVSRWLVTLSPTALWWSWLLFRAAKNKTPLVFLRELWEGKSPAFPKCPDLSCGAPSCTREMMCQGLHSLRFPEGFPHSLVPGDLEKQLLSLDNAFLWSRIKCINHFFWTRQHFSTDIINKYTLAKGVRASGRVLLGLALLVVVSELVPWAVSRLNPACMPGIACQAALDALIWKEVRS